MTELLRQSGKRVVGTKQVLRALKDEKAAQVYLCKDADDFIYRQVQTMCEEKRVPLSILDSMAELGKMCLVSVKTATAAVLK